MIIVVKHFSSTKYPSIKIIKINDSIYFNIFQLNIFNSFIFFLLLHIINKMTDVSGLEVLPRKESILVKWDGFKNADDTVHLGHAESSNALLGNIYIDVIDASLNKQTKLVYKSAVPFVQDASNANVHSYLVDGLVAGKSYKIVLRANVDFTGAASGDADLTMILNNNEDAVVPYTNPQPFGLDQFTLTNDLSANIIVTLNNPDVFESSANLLAEVGYNTLDTIRFEFTDVTAGTLSYSSFIEVSGGVFQKDGTDDFTFDASLEDVYKIQAFVINDTMEEIAGPVINYTPSTLTKPQNLNIVRTAENTVFVKAEDGEQMDGNTNAMKVQLFGSTSYAGAYVALTPMIVKDKNTDNTHEKSINLSDHGKNLTSFKKIKAEVRHYTDAETGVPELIETVVLPSPNTQTPLPHNIKLNYGMVDGVETAPASANLYIDGSFGVPQWVEDLSGGADLLTEANGNFVVDVSTKVHVSQDTIGDAARFALTPQEISWNDISATRSGDDKQFTRELNDTITFVDISGLVENKNVRIVHKTVISIDASGQPDDKTPHEYVHYDVKTFMVPQLPTYGLSFEHLQNQLNSQFTIPSQVYAPYLGSGNVAINYVLHKDTNTSITQLTPTDISSVVAGTSERINVSGNSHTDPLTYNVDNSSNVYRHTLLAYSDVVDPTSGETFRLHARSVDDGALVATNETQPFILPDIRNVRYEETDETGESGNVIKFYVANWASLMNEIDNAQMQFKLYASYKLLNDTEAEYTADAEISVTNGFDIYELSGNYEVSKANGDALVPADTGYMYKMFTAEHSRSIHDDVSHGQLDIVNTGKVYGEIETPLLNWLRNGVQVGPVPINGSGTSLEVDTIEDDATDLVAGLTGKMKLNWETNNNFIEQIKLYRREGIEQGAAPIQIINRDSSGVLAVSGEYVDPNPTYVKPGSVAGVQYNDDTFYQASVRFENGETLRLYSHTRKLLAPLAPENVGLKEVVVDVSSGDGHLYGTHRIHQMPAWFDVQLTLTNMNGDSLAAATTFDIANLDKSEDYEISGTKLSTGGSNQYTEDTNSAHKVKVTITGDKEFFDNEWVEHEHKISNHVLHDISGLEVRAVQTDNDVENHELTYVKFTHENLYQGVVPKYYDSAGISYEITEDWAAGTYVPETGSFKLGYAIHGMTHNDELSGNGLVVTRGDADLLDIEAPANNPAFPPVRDLEIDNNPVEPDVSYVLRWTSPQGRTPVYFEIVHKDLSGNLVEDPVAKVGFSFPGPYEYDLSSGSAAGDVVVVRANYGLQSSVRSLVEIIDSRVPEDPSGSKIEALNANTIVLSTEEHAPEDGVEYGTVSAKVSVFDAVTDEERGQPQTFSTPSNMVFDLTSANLVESEGYYFVVRFTGDEGDSSGADTLYFTYNPHDHSGFNLIINENLTTLEIKHVNTPYDDDVSSIKYNFYLDGSYVEGAEQTESLDASWNDKADNHSVDSVSVVENFRSAATADADAPNVMEIEAQYVFNDVSGQPSDRPDVVSQRVVFELGDVNEDVKATLLESKKRIQISMEPVAGDKLNNPLSSLIFVVKYTSETREGMIVREVELNKLKGDEHEDLIVDFTSELLSAGGPSATLVALSDNDRIFTSNKYGLASVNTPTPVQ